jgi:hypothetical protein
VFGMFYFVAFRLRFRMASCLNLLRFRMRMGEPEGMEGTGRLRMTGWGPGDWG